MPQQRATAQTMIRPGDGQGQSQGPSEDLFPDHARDEQFEIPAFLRRQAN